jgi:hypothetical protein
MNNWPLGTRNRLIFVLLVGVGVLLCGWFGLISPLQARLRLQKGKAEYARMQLQLAQTGQDRGPFYRELLAERRAEMENLEFLMADASDLLGWGFGMLVPYFKLYDIVHLGWEIPVLTDVDMPPDVPYRMATFGVSGQAHYHAFGRFLAAFENGSPFVKIKSVSLQSLTPGIGGVVRGMDDLEQLRFRLEYQVLAKTNSVATAQ